MENSKARKGLRYARKAIALTATNPNASGRIALAKAALGPHGNYDDGAKSAWADYLAAGCPRYAA